MNLRGIGVDIQKVKRFKRSVERGGERILKKIFTRTELEYCLSMKDPYPHLTARFCLKEAVLKAFGTGVSGGVTFRDVEVCQESSGKPYVRLHGRLRELSKELGVSGVFVSMSHSGDYAVAVAVLLA